MSTKVTHFLCFIVVRAQAVACLAQLYVHMQRNWHKAIIWICLDLFVMKIQIFASKMHVNIQREHDAKHEDKHIFKLCYNAKFGF